MALSTIETLIETAEPAEEASSADESAASSGAEEEQVEQGEVNVGWADSIAKVLNSTKPKAKKTLVLSRAKKVKPVAVKRKSEKEEFGFEVAESSVKIDAEEEQTDAKPKVKKEKKEDEIDEKPKNLKLSLRVRPSWKDIERERALRKVATKGVVQLFNAVRIQQKELQQNLEEAGPLDSRRDAVLNNIDKRKFLDVLMSGNRAKSEYVDGAVKTEEYENTSSGSSEEDEEDDGDNTHKKKKKWSVLDSDFLTNKKAKHWDEEDNDDEPEFPSSEDESEND